MEREELLKSFGIEPYTSPYADLLMKGIPKGKRKKVDTNTTTKHKKDVLGEALGIIKENRENKYGSAGLGGLDKDGLGDAIFRTFNQLFKQGK